MTNGRFGASDFTAEDAEDAEDADDAEDAEEIALVFLTG